jgi:RHS repeat-associated protein
VKVVTYGGGGADRVWGRDHNLNSAFDSADVIRDEFEYTGRLWDNRTQLQFNRARWLNPATGQFMGKDSYGYRAGDANLYRYAGNDPVNVTDPSGHFGLLVQRHT